MTEFLLGTHRPNWLYPGRREFKPRGPLFVSIRQVRERRWTPYPECDTPFALDSGGFTEIHKFGTWKTSAKDYARDVEALAAETKTLRWAAIQDYMCEDSALQATGLTVRDHQARTIRSFLELRDLAPGIQWLPVLQGREVEDYLRHVDMYAKARVDLAALPLVGLGSVCRRQTESEIVDLSSELRAAGLRLHGFGVKLQGLELAAENFESADSIAWSLHERKWKTGRANSQAAAEEYRTKVQAVIDRRLWKVSEFVGSIVRTAKTAASKIVSWVCNRIETAKVRRNMKAQLSLITRDALEKAAAEFDRLGREAFLAKYGFKPSNKYQAKIGGKSYDSKALIGCAAQWTEIGRALTHDQFSGGPARLRGVLVRNGFELVQK